MNYDIYRYLLTIVKTRSITRAAEELHISQPALTKALRKQEEELGVKLFDRKILPITPTYAGERYFENVRKLLEIEEGLRDEMHNIANGTQERVRIGIPVNRGVTWLPHILLEFRKVHPEVEVKVMDGADTEFEKALLNNSLDFCISTMPVMSQNFDFELAGSFPICLISSSEHPLARYVDIKSNSFSSPQYVDPQLLNEQNFLTVMPGQSMHRITMQILEKYALRVNIVMQLSSLHTVTTLAAAGYGLAFTTYQGAKVAIERKEFHPLFYTVEDPVYQRYNVIVYKKNRIFTPAVRALIDLAREELIHFPQPKVKVRH